MIEPIAAMHKGNRPGKGRRSFHLDDGALISYEVRGEGPVPVVFLHGFAAALTTWDDIVPLFSPDRYTLYLLDLKGFGRSSKPAGARYDPQAQADAVAAFMEGLDLSGAVLVGHSLGGGIALLVLLRTPAGARIGKLVLITPAAYPQRLPPVMRLMRHRLPGLVLLHLLPLRVMVRRTLGYVFFRRSAITPERVARYVSCFDREGIDEVFIATCRTLDPARYAGVTELYRTITVPTLVVAGENDRVVSPSHAFRLVADIPCARLALIPACGHNPHEEWPQETFAAISGFFAAPPGPSAPSPGNRCKAPGNVL